MINKSKNFLGHCCVQYQVCDDDPTAFTLDGTYNDDAPSGPVEFKTGGDSVCLDDYIGIEGREKMHDHEF